MSQDWIVDYKFVKLFTSPFQGSYSDWLEAVICRDFVCLSAELTS